MSAGERTGTLGPLAERLGRIDLSTVDVKAGLAAAWRSRELKLLARLACVAPAIGGAVALCAGTPLVIGAIGGGLLIFPVALLRVDYRDAAVGRMFRWVDALLRVPPVDEESVRRAAQDEVARAEGVDGLLWRFAFLFEDGVDDRTAEAMLDSRAGRPLDPGTYAAVVRCVRTRVALRDRNARAARQRENFAELAAAARPSD